MRALGARRPAAAGAALGAAGVALAGLATGVETPFGYLVLLLALVMFGTARLAAAVPACVAGAATLGLALVAAGEDEVVPTAFLVVVPFVAGWDLRRRAALTTALAARAVELEAEQELYAELSVRHERARIAAELHDIVAHAISVMVVQAGAGQRLAAHDPEATTQALHAIGDAARQAQADMGRLVAMLGPQAPAATTRGTDLVEELVARAATTGVDVRLRLQGDWSTVEGLEARGIFLVVREGLTNALRHAAGATVRVGLVREENALTAEVVNGPGGVGGAPGGGNGLRGLRERLDAVGGRLAAGPTADGGWRLAARVPCGTGVGAAGVAGHPALS